MEQSFPDERKINTLSATGAARQSKHMESVEMIGRIQQTQNRFQELIDEICGQPVAVNERLDNHRDVMPLSALSEFLNATPEQLASINNRLEDQISHLRDLLL